MNLFCADFILIKIINNNGKVLFTVMLSDDSENPRKKEIKKIIEENDIEFIRLQFVDIFGLAKNIAITTDELDKALNGELMFDGSSVDGFGRVEESDMYLVPDLNTFETIPWEKEGIAHIYCDVYGPDKQPFRGCPRRILKNALKEASEMGYELGVGPEGEFFLFHLDEEDNPLFNVHDNAGYFDLSPVDKGEQARRDIILTMKKYGFSIEASHHEVAPGQHEIDFKYDEALVTADKWMIFKQIVKNIAHSHGLYASFIPKPFSGENANAMHCNQSLMKDGRNIFYDPDGYMELSETALYYIGGLMKHAKGIAAICNPTVNSYKRLVPGYEAPVNIVWSCSNRSAFIRIPDSRGEGTRIELRTPDPTANIYLVFAVMLKAGLDGIKNRITPPKECNGNIYKPDNTQGCQYIERYPRNLLKALECMKQDPLIEETLGKRALNTFYNAKIHEWEDYEREVHNWEIKKYLKKY